MECWVHNHTIWCQSWNYTFFKNGGSIESFIGRTDWVYFESDKRAKWWKTGCQKAGDGCITDSFIFVVIFLVRFKCSVLGIILSATLQAPCGQEWFNEYPEDPMLKDFTKHRGSEVLGKGHKYCEHAFGYSFHQMGIQFQVWITNTQSFQLSYVSFSIIDASGRLNYLECFIFRYNPPLNICVTIPKTVNVTFACMPGVYKFVLAFESCRRARLYLYQKNSSSFLQVATETKVKKGTYIEHCAPLGTLHYRHAFHLSLKSIKLILWFLWYSVAQ